MAKKRKTRARLINSRFKKNAEATNRAEQGAVVEVSGTIVGEQGTLVNEAQQGEAILDRVTMQARSNFTNQAFGSDAVAEAKELEIGEDAVVENSAQIQPPSIVSGAQAVPEEEKDQSRYLLTASMQSVVVGHHSTVTNQTVVNILPEQKSESPAKKPAFILQQLQKSLRANYSNYTQLERLFDDTKTPIAASFIHLALIKEAEHKTKEQRLARGDREEKDKEKNDDDGRQQLTDYIDERRASHEQLYAVKEPFALTELFEPKDDTPAPYKILILGQAGIGKSILCQYLATQWAYESKVKQSVGNYLRQKFDAVFWLKLREIAAKTTREDTLTSVIHQFCLGGVKENKPTSEELADYLNKYTHRTLFILDGYDEITDRIDQAEHAHLKSILDEVIANQHLLLTSRPITIDALGSNPIRFDRRLENMGFLNENIKAYVGRFMEIAQKPEQSAPMLNFLKTHPSVWGIAHIPINLELLSWLWSKGKLDFKGQIITLSKLYQTIIDHVQEIYIRKPRKPRKRAIALPLDARLPNKKEVEAPHYLVETKAEGGTVIDLVNEFLERLAYHAMEKETLFIPPSDVRTALEKILTRHGHLDQEEHQEQLLKSATDKLGFLRAVGESNDSQLEQDHYFIHLSFQEFYAAKYITRILSEEPNSEEAKAIFQLICIEKYTPRYQLVLWMSAGLLYQQGKKNQRFSPLLYFWRAILSQPRDLIGFHHIVLVMHCLDECEVDEQLILHQALVKQQWNWLQAYMKKEGEETRLYIEQLARCPIFHTSKLIISGLLEALQDKEENVRQVAVESLGHLNNPSEDVIQALVKALLEDKNGWVRKQAVISLGKLSNSSEDVIQVLLEILQNKEGWARRAAVESLGDLVSPNEHIIQALLNALQDREEDVRQAAVESLGRLNNPGENVIQALLKILQDQEENMRQSKNTVQALIEASQVNRRLMKRRVVESLGKLSNSSENVIQALLKALQDKEKDMRQAAVESLGYLSNPSENVIQALLKALQDKEEYVREAAVESLGYLSNPSESVIQALLKALQDKEEYVREAAIKSLGHLRNPSDDVIQALLKALQDEEKTREAMMESFGYDYLSSSSEEVLLIKALEHEGEIKKVAINLLNKLSNSNENVIQMLLKASQNKEGDVRRAAVKLLGCLSNPRENVIQGLLNALQDKGSWVRRASAESLGKLGNLTEPVVQALSLRALQDEEMSVREAAVNSLGHLRSPSENVMQVLSRALQDKEMWVKKASAESLSKLSNLSEDVIQTLLEALEDKEEKVEEVIGSEGNEEGMIEVWLNALQDKKSEVREAAVESLSHLTNPKANVVHPLLIIAVQDEEYLVKHAAIEALGKLSNSSQEVVRALLNALQDKEEKIKEVAAKSLGDLINPKEEVIQALQKAMQDEGKMVKEAAVRSLHTLQNLTNSTYLGHQAYLKIFHDQISIRSVITRTLLKAVQHMNIVFERLTDKQCSSYFSYWFKYNHHYLLCINYQEGRAIIYKGARTYDVPLTPARLTWLEQQVITVARQENRPLDIYNVLGYDSCYAKEAVLQENKKGCFMRFVSNAIWVVHLVRKKDNQHAFLIIEGMQSERHIIQCFEYIESRFIQSRDSRLFSSANSRVNQLTSVENFLKTLANDQENYQSKSWDIEPIVGQKLLQSLEANTSFPREESLNCLAWAEAQLEKINLSLKGDWGDFSVVLPRREIPFSPGAISTASALESDDASNSSLGNVENSQSQGSQLPDFKEEAPPDENIAPTHASSQRSYALYGLGIFGMFAAVSFAVRWQSYSYTSNSNEF